MDSKMRIDQQAVLLVSRALACVQVITAILDITSLPYYLVTLHHYLQIYVPPDFYISREELDIACLLARIALLTFFAYVFWSCGPRIARFLLPEPETAPPPA